MAMMGAATLGACIASAADKLHSPSSFIPLPICPTREAHPFTSGLITGVVHHG
jgi:hypothetical protein